MKSMSSCQIMSELASKYTRLMRDKKSGKYFGICPFCHDKISTFSADNENGLFFCYSCGVHGNQKEFQERIDPQKRDFLVSSKDPVLLKIYEKTALYYYQRLTDGRNPGYEYLKSRGICRESIDEYGLGYAPDSFTEIDQFLMRSFSEDDILRSGLVKISKKGYRYDFFRNRVMFPIMDGNGDVIAFGGRVMDESRPKYINSSETAIFNKRENLYGFPYDAKIRGETLIICEGYMDYIAIHKAGIFDCAAVLGTALTKEHAKLIGDYYNQVCLAFDSDGAGIYASKKSIQILQEARIDVWVLDFKPFKDPDEFLRKGPEGKAGFFNRIDGALPANIFLARNAQDTSELIDILMQQV